MPIEIKNSKKEVIYTHLSDTLVGANLRNLNLQDAVLSGIDCTGAIFDDSDLSFAHCRKTNFTNASFRNVYMLKAQFQEAIFIGTDFENVDMERAQCTNANFTGAKNWHKRKRDYQASFWGATMPDGRKVENK